MDPSERRSPKREAGQAAREVAADTALAEGASASWTSAGAALDDATARGAWAEIDLLAIRGNLDYARGLIPEPTRMMAVVKADAYGHGMAAVAAEALAWGCDWLGVGNLAEGLALRDLGIRARCLVLAPPLAGEAADYVAADLVPSIDSVEQAEMISGAAQAARRGPREVHLLVDTGIGRYGVTPAGLAALGAAVARLPGVRVAGVYTHFASPANASQTRRDLTTFLDAVSSLQRELGGEQLLIHAAGSEAALLVPGTRLGMVRLGNIIYGYWGGPRGELPAAAAGGPGLRPAWRLKCRVAAVRDFSRGQRLGYGGYRAPRAMRVAVLPVGFSDGVGLRAVQGGAGTLAVLWTMAKEALKTLLPGYRQAVIVGGKRAPVVGRVGMQFTLVDVSSIPDVGAGDEAELPGVRATAAAGVPRVYRR